MHMAWCIRGPRSNASPRLSPSVMRRRSLPTKMGFVRRAPRAGLGRPAEVVPALFAEAPEAEHQRADDDAEAADEEQGPPAAIDQPLGSQDAEERTPPPTPTVKSVTVTSVLAPITAAPWAG